MSGSVEYLITDPLVNGGEPFSCYRWVVDAASGSAADGGFWLIGEVIESLPTIIAGPSGRTVYWRFGDGQGRTGPGTWRQSFRDGPLPGSTEIGAGDYYDGTNAPF